MLEVLNSHLFNIFFLQVVEQLNVIDCAELGTVSLLAAVLPTGQHVVLGRRAAGLLCPREMVLFCIIHKLNLLIPFVGLVSRFNEVFKNRRE